MPYYFAYGSNLSARQMMSRCPSAVSVCVGWLDDWALCFPRVSRKRWGGGVAGIEQAPGERVYGAVYELTADDIAALDGFEGVPRSYQRVTLAVDVRSGHSYDCAVYIAQPDPAGPFAPSASYIQTILTGAREHVLPDAYIAFLETYIPDSKGSTP